MKEKRDDTFRSAMHDVEPIRAHNRVDPYRVPAPPVPVKRHEDERAVIEELARSIVDDEAEIEEDASYLRPGLPRDILRRLRRTHWVIQDDLDLHGMNSAHTVSSPEGLWRRHGCLAMKENARRATRRWNTRRASARCATFAREKHFPQERWCIAFTSHGAAH